MLSFPLPSSHVQIHTVPSNTTLLISFILKPLVLRNVAHHQPFSINPQNQNYVVLFESSQLLQKYVITKKL
jgi:hypothetical protein